MFLLTIFELLIKKVIINLVLYCIAESTKVGTKAKFRMVDNKISLYINLSIINMSQYY